MALIIPKRYKLKLLPETTELAIMTLKEDFQHRLAKELNLRRVTAPLFVLTGTGINDDLNGTERSVKFPIKCMGDRKAEVVHSLAKWKRMKLGAYGIAPGYGLYTDMNAIRSDEELDNLHSLYVDQWDWEKIITRESRNAEYLKLIVCAIVKSICDTNDALRVRFPQLTVSLSPDVTFITSQELEDMYPTLTPGQREDALLREHRTAFIMQIGGRLRSGKPHDGRAPDYDDWQLNGDLFFWDDVLGRALEISSMGIRVDAESLDRQLTLAGCDDRRALPFHQMLLRDELPLTIGGGIGQSRLCMLMMGCAHIGEVQSSLWDAETVAVCEAAGVRLL